MMTPEQIAEIRAQVNAVKGDNLTVAQQQRAMLLADRDELVARKDVLEQQCSDFARVCTENRREIERAEAAAIQTQQMFNAIQARIARLQAVAVTMNARCMTRHEKGVCPLCDALAALEPGDLP